MSKVKNAPAVKNETKSAKKPVKFAATSVEAVTIKAIKSRQKKIDNTGSTLAGLWYEQGKELRELQLVLECSGRALEQHTGLKRSAIAAYMNIAEDPRLGEEGISKQLGNFSQKQLVQLGKLDEDEFNDALETGVLPKSETEKSEAKHPVEDVTAEPKAESKWATELKAIIDNAKGNYDTAKADIEAYFSMDAILDEVEDDEVEEAEEAEEIPALVAEAIELTEETDIGEQALAIGIKKGVLKKAIAGVISAATEKKLTAYVNS